MELEKIVGRHGGVMRAEDLHRATGGSRGVVSRAVAARRLVRPRRGWVAVPDADPMLTAAAETGVVISCVTRTARLGLWDVEPARIHVAAKPGRRLLRPTVAHVHWAKPVIPRHPGVLEDSLENALLLVADCQPYENGLAIWESALRQGLITYDLLDTLPLGPNARRLFADARPFSDAGVESIVIPRLVWLRVPLRQQSWVLGHRVDLRIGDRLILQIDGGHHVGPQRLQDNEHDARLRLAGYHVIRIGYWQIRDDWATVQDLIAGAVGRGLHLAPIRRALR